MTTRQAARILGCSQQYVTKLIRDKKLQARYEIDEEEVERFKETIRHPGRPRGSKNHATN